MTPVFAGRTHAAFELGEAELPELQRFLDANPEYFVAVSGAPPRPDEAVQEFHEQPPAHLPHGRRWFLGLRSTAGPLDGLAIVVRDLGAEGVWHLALFLLATRLHGQGIAAELHAALQGWARAAGAQWLRLGVVVGNSRAERFWERLGYVETRRRDGIAAGARTNTVRVLVKPLQGQTLADYRARVPRDRPDSTDP